MKYCITVTNHGVHEFDLDAGAPDTGGQNVFVNQMSQGLVDLGWDVTIFNRGGYPHPRTGVPRRGTITAPPPYSGTLRTVLLEDEEKSFIRKEHMGGRIEALAQALAGHLRQMLDSDRPPALIISHYWDGGCVAVAAYRAVWPHGGGPVHVWVPHSLGAVKRRNMSRERWASLGLDEREARETKLLQEDQLDLVGSTSKVIEQALTQDYRYQGAVQFLPPCVDTERFFPGTGSVEPDTAHFLAQHCPLTATEIQGMRILAEISRTDRTKRKDIVIEMFIRLSRRRSDILLAITIDVRQEDVATELLQQIEQSGFKDRVVVLGNVAPQVPALLRSSYLYVTPSEMEGFGMSIQEAAACAVPAVSSDLVPFAVEYLDHGAATGDVEQKGALVVPHGEVDAFTDAVESLLDNRTLRDRMGTAARAITVPAFTWSRTLKRFLTVCEVETQLSPGRAQELLVRDGMESTNGPVNTNEIPVPSLPGIKKVAAELATRHNYNPEGRSIIDPRDGTRILYNEARARRPSDNKPGGQSQQVDAIPSEDASDCIVCNGITTPIIDIASLSRGFTFINFNLYPMVLPGMGEDQHAEDQHAEEGTRVRGLHLLQWTSSLHSRDWHTLASRDRFVVLQRLAAMEKRLVDDGRYVTIIKNYGHLVGGSLVHGHQQIAATDVPPARFERNQSYRDRAGQTVSGKLTELFSTRGLALRRFETGTLGVAPWMRRPYEMVYTVHDERPGHLFALNDAQLRDLGDALGTGISAMLKIFPLIGKEPAYNIVFNTGPGAGLYIEFFPYTQELGGFEHAGLYVCQATPELCHKTYALDILSEQCR